METNEAKLKSIFEPTFIKIIISMAVIIFIFISVILIVNSNHNRYINTLLDEQNERDYRIAQQQLLVDRMQDEIILLNANNEAIVNEMSTEIYGLHETIDELVAGLPPGITTETVQSTIRQAAELTTLIHEYTDVTIQDEANFFTNRLLIIRYSGIIRAGIDFDDIIINVVDYIIYIDVPQARMFSHEMPFDAMDVVRDETGLFTPSNTIPDFVNLMAELQRDKEIDMLENSLLDSARENAQDTIRQLIYTMILAQRGNPADYTIVFNS